MAFDAAELARRSVQHWNEGDLDGIYADWDPDIIVRPDPNFPDAAELVGELAARRFWEDNSEFMGLGHAEILEEHDLGDRCLQRIRQHVEAPASGVHSSYDWSWLTTARAGRVTMIEFFIDHRHALVAAGLASRDS